MHIFDSAPFSHTDAADAIEAADPGGRLDEIVDFLDIGLRVHGVGPGNRFIDCPLQPVDTFNGQASKQYIRPSYRRYAQA